MHTLWKAVWWGFENEDGSTITVNADTYRTMKTDFFLSAIHGIDVNNVWFYE